MSRELGNLGTFQDLSGSILLTDIHKAGHFALSQVNFFATEFSQADILNFLFVVFNY